MAATSLVSLVREHIFDGDGLALLEDWKTLSDKDKNDLADYFQAEGFEVIRPGH